LTRFPAGAYTQRPACLDPVSLQEDWPVRGKLFAGGLLLVACLGLLTVRVSSQEPPPPNQDASLTRLVQEWENVRAQKAELDKREKQLVEQIAKAIQEERQRLNQKVRQLDQIEGLLYPDGRGKQPHGSGSGPTPNKKTDD
jgi:hypothetical protein